jgi:hypothetical protein
MLTCHFIVPLVMLSFAARGIDEDECMSIPESCLKLQGRLIVSCQADESDAFYGLMDRFARAAAAGGAAGIRANGPQDVRAIRNAVDQDNPLLIQGLEQALSLLVPVWQRRLKILNSSVGYHAGVLGAAAVALRQNTL